MIGCIFARRQPATTVAKATPRKSARLTFAADLSATQPIERPFSLGRCRPFLPVPLPSPRLEALPSLDVF